MVNRQRRPGALGARVVAFVVLLCAGLLAGCGPDEPDGVTHVSVGVGGSIFDTPMRMAEEKGFFRAAGLDVEFVNLTASLYAAALQSDSVQFINDSPTDFLTAVSRKIPEIAVGMDGAGSPLGLIVSTRFAQEHGLTAQSPPEVVAKALIGSTGGASSNTTKGQAGIFLREYGVDPAAVHYVMLPSPAADKASLHNNQIDWFVTSEPTPLAVQDAGDGIVVASPGSVPAWSTARSGYGQLVVVRQSYADENSDLVRRFIKAVQDGSAYTRAHESEAVEVMSKTLTSVAKPTLLASLRLVDFPETGAMDEQGWTTSMSFISQEGAFPKGTKLTQENWTNEYLP
ncbi:ABC transporter substrate-binding protein [Amycolatopsis acidicola]|uniref:ABC transporter substrate-binding protein n=1 Tax=Amycolatopsis acidicola TaxID=2596893 RepID=UPI00140D6737|nr:ABC transporter substrate-binding protein [Amycolatopsis acidicola]